MRHSLKLRSGMLSAGVLSIGLLAAFTAPPSRAMTAGIHAPMQKAADNQTVADKTADAWITTKVKSEFAASKGIKATDISVSTNDGVVTLSGSVASLKVKQKAERVAQRVKGVKSVEDSGLTVGTATQ